MIEGIGIRGYRSFGRETQYIGPFGKLNVISGKNNSGKSNLIRFIQELLPQFADQATSGKLSHKLSEMDQHVGEGTVGFAFSLGVKTYDYITKDFLKKRKIAGKEEKAVRGILASNVLGDGSGLSWFNYELGGETQFESEFMSLLVQAQDIDPMMWLNLQEAYSGRRGGEKMFRLKTYSKLSTLWRTLEFRRWISYRPSDKLGLGHRPKRN